MVEDDPAAVRAALERVLRDRDLRARLSAEGRRTAESYAWPALIDKVEHFFEGVAPGPR
jgi:glycosyltransferase involved in cell wall biosynthesis